MRRWLSILLVAFFGLGPLAATLPANDDSRLPACCRRHGAHHCVLTTRMAAMLAESTKGSATLTAPMTCPLFPGYGDVSTVPLDALTTPAMGMPVLLSLAHSRAGSRAAARLSQIRTRPGRGPPVANLL
jgi:hypothetical protein